MVGSEVKKKSLCLFLCILILLSFSACAKKSSGQVTLSNADFSAIKNSGVPMDWDVVSYEGTYDVSTSDNIVSISSQYEDDLRLVQSVSVEERTKYVLTCEARAVGVFSGKGVNLSIDNMSVDGSCVVSYDAITGDSDWQSIELAFETIDNQTEAVVALRLGYYGDVSSGKAQFRNVKLVQSSEANVAYQVLNPWSSGSSEEATDGVKTADEYNAYLALIIMMSVLILILMWGVYRKREGISKLALPKNKLTILFVALVGVGLVVRMLLCALFGGHNTDMQCWISWGNTMASGGPSSFYANTWCDYPPAYMLVLGILSKIGSALKLSNDSTGGLFLYMVPAFLADIGIAWLCVRVCKKLNRSNGFALLVAAFVILNPALTFLSGAWSQIDSILTFFLLLSFVLLFDEKRILAGLVFGIAIMFKWQALMFGPVLAAAYLFTIKDVKSALKTAGGVMAAIAVIFLFTLIMRPQGESTFFLFNRFFNSTQTYDRASVEAYNFLALLKGNWAMADSFILNSPINFKTLGTLAIVLSVALSMGGIAWVSFKQKSKALVDKQFAILAISAFSMYAIYTFGHYMHERYIIPVILFILLAYVFKNDKRLLLSVIFLTFTTLLNEMTAMFVVSEGAIDVIRGGVPHNDIVRFCSAMEVASFAYYTSVIYKLIFDKENSVKL